MLNNLLNTAIKFKVKTSKNKSNQTLQQQEEDLLRKPTNLWEKIRLYF